MDGEYPPSSQMCTQCLPTPTREFELRDSSGDIIGHIQTSMSNHVTHKMLNKWLDSIESEDAAMRIDGFIYYVESQLRNATIKERKMDFTIITGD